MEKFSAYRDPGTGIQPFLTPVPPSGSHVLANLLSPFGYALAAARSLLVLLLLAVYVVTVRGICVLLRPIPPVYRSVTRLTTAILTRSALFIMGLFWIPVEHVSRKRGRGRKISSWAPKAGDLIVSNWVSWVEILWLVFRFDPIFVLPVFDPLPPPSSGLSNATIAHTPGRRTGTGSANISSKRPAVSRGHFRGFRTATFLEMVTLTGRVSPYDFSDHSATYRTLEDVRKSAGRPIVAFPECTTSNGRGLLRFSNIFPSERVPTKGFQVFIMCVRYDPPSNITPSLSLPIPARLNPLPHLFSIATSFIPLTISIRLLDPADSPSSQIFMVSDVVPDAIDEDVFVETCATLIAQLGRLKRTGMGWEDKSSFSEFYQSRKS